MKFKQKNSTKTLSDKIAAALTVKPRADIEEDQVFCTKPKTVSRADFTSSESEDEAAISDFRKRNVNLLSDIKKKYEGKVVSRKHKNEIDSDTSESNISIVSDAYGLGDDHKFQDSINGKTSNHDRSSSDKELNTDLESKDESEDDGESDNDSKSNIRKQSANEVQSETDHYDDEDEGYDISQMEEPIQDDFVHIKKQNISEEAKKGICVRNQLLLWEGLLEMRIHLQRCVNIANQMPMPELHAELIQNDNFMSESSTTKTNVANALEKLLTLQNVLLKGFPETKNIATNKSGKGDKAAQKPTASDEEIPSDADDEEIPSDTENEDIPSDTEEKDNVAIKKMKVTNKNIKKRKITDYETDIASSHKAFKSFRDSTIQKWNEKTRVATAASIKQAPTNSILQQVSYILSDKNKLLRRTQLKRTEYNIVGYKKESKEENKNENGNEGVMDRKENDEYISEIFDDNDFYHQLLRELIECKSADISDPVQLSRQWIALQQMRSKMKRRVDTKATKGRKIKYVVHKPLINFMAPEICTTWTDEATNELYNSLFGKLFEQNNVGLNASLVKIKE